jgi:WD40 repeat protein
LQYLNQLIILNLVYSNFYKSIVSYNIIDNKKIIDIKNAHKNKINNFRHHLDTNNNPDLLISISAIDMNMKLWKLDNWECLFNINKVGFLFSVCFLEENNQTYIMTGNVFIKVYDLKGKIIKELKEPNDKTYVIESYYDKNLSKIFIITGNEDHVKSFDYNNNAKLYHKYCNGEDDEEENIPHYGLIVYNSENCTKLIETGLDGYIRIWNFHTGNLLMSIKAGISVIPGNISKKILKMEMLCGICLWNDEFLFAGCNKAIKIIELKNGNILKTINDDNIITLKKIQHPQLGECLITQGSEYSKIKLLKIKI